MNYLSVIFLLFNFVALPIANSYSQRKFPLFNRQRLDSVFEETNVSLTYSDNQSTCFVLYKEKHIVLSNSLLTSLIEGYKVKTDSFFIEGILSHEYGHIKQFHRQMDMDSDELFMLRELHCDLMAGYYLSNYFRNEFLKGDIADATIIDQVCRFFSSRDRNPNLYLIVSMLINSIYDYTYDEKLFNGNSFEDVKLLRFTSFWQGIRLSENTSINKVYDDGLNYIKNLIENKQQNKTYKTFKIIGLDTLNNILHQKYSCRKTISVMTERISNAADLSLQEKIYNAFIINAVGSCCP